jgi:hypothetical protein
MTTGSLRLDEGSGIELKLATIRTVVAELRRPLAEPLRVRELWLRGPEREGQGAPDLELFVDLASAEGRTIRDLRNHELPVIAVALASDRRSRVRLPGSDAHALVSEGQLVLKEVFTTDSAGTFRVEGGLKLVVRENAQERALAGHFSARLLSD